MTRRPCTFKQNDATRLLRAAKAAGASKAHIEVEDGKMTMDVDLNGRSNGAAHAGDNEWDEVFDNDHGNDQA
jgi:hypothetical protein